MRDVVDINLHYAIDFGSVQVLFPNDIFNNNKKKRKGKTESLWF